MDNRPQIKKCPTCGSNEIRREVRDITRKYSGKTYTVPKVGLYVCPHCDEKVYDHEAMLKIEAHSPAYHKVETLVE